MIRTPGVLQTTKNTPIIEFHLLYYRTIISCLIIYHAHTPCPDVQMLWEPMIAFVKLLQEKEIPRPFCSQDACLAAVSPRELSDHSSSGRLGNRTITNTDGLKPSENPTNINLNNWFTRCYFPMCENRQVFLFGRLRACANSQNKIVNPVILHMKCPSKTTNHEPETVCWSKQWYQ